MHYVIITTKDIQRTGIFSSKEPVFPFYRQIGHFAFDVCYWKSLDNWTDLDPQKY